jgi:hypothetical protein
MKSNSDRIPERISQSAGKYQIAYNITEVVKEDMNGSRTSYDYDYVAIDEVTRPKIINAIIAEVHTKDAELALINNELASPGTAEYTEYQALRAMAKRVAGEVLG